jgi:hypothetical protein
VRFGTVKIVGAQDGLQYPPISANEASVEEDLPSQCDSKASDKRHSPGHKATIHANMEFKQCKKSSHLIITSALLIDLIAEAIIVWIHLIALALKRMV